MKKLKRLFLNRRIGFIGLCCFSFAPAMAANDFSMAKQLWGPAGSVALSGGTYSLSFAWGESMSGEHLLNAPHSVESGYYGGRFGSGQTFSVMSTKVGGSPAYFNQGLQIGVTIQASIGVHFSDQLDPATVPSGITGMLIQNHLAQSENKSIRLSWDYDPTGTTLIIKPESSWEGNSVYELMLLPDLKSVNGYALEAHAPIRFMTMADPHKSNVITNAFLNSTAINSPSADSTRAPVLSIQLEPESVSDFSVYLFNTDPLRHPWHIDPSLLQEANEKTQQIGSYQSAVGYLEIAAYNPEGKALRTLTQPARLTVSYSSFEDKTKQGRLGPVALWTLDTEHRLWVKIPGSLTTGSWLTAPITRLSVFALITQAVGSASEVYVFPNPWRPNGPRAGQGILETGTEQGGMTFNTLPSECKIKIYTLSGRLVRELAHSDIAGPVAQEIWDGRTSTGASAASGVYLWRVESPQDGKNGKLIIIR